MRENWLAFALILLLATQLAALALRPAAGTAGPATRAGVGDDLSGLQVMDSAGGARTFVSGDTTLLLVFHSECAHCRTVAPVWKAWLDANRGTARVVALAAEPFEAAEAFATEFAWEVDVWTVDAARRGAVAHGLTSRTPWLFLVDGSGVILAEGHGSHIAELTAGVLGTTPAEVAGP